MKTPWGMIDWFRAWRAAVEQRNDAIRWALSDTTARRAVQLLYQQESDEMNYWGNGVPK